MICGPLEKWFRLGIWGGEKENRFTKVSNDRDIHLNRSRKMLNAHVAQLKTGDTHSKRYKLLAASEGFNQPKK